MISYGIILSHYHLRNFFSNSYLTSALEVFVCLYATNWGQSGERADIAQGPSILKFQILYSILKVLQISDQKEYLGNKEEKQSY